jgi:trehalose 6-phosphate phosphatase
MPSLPPPPAALLDGASLYLDLDGTLVEFADRPDSIAVGAELRELLTSLAKRLDGRLAIVSGRGIDDLDHHLALTGIALAGSHGIERRLADGRISGPVPIGTLAELQREAEDYAALHGMLAERKPHGIAIHFRDSPERGDSVEAFTADLADRHGLKLQRGAMVRELRPSGADKGDAVRAFQAEPPFASGRPVFVGDDVTDEDAFRAVADMGGAGVLVGDERETAATYRLPSVPAVLDWLKG